VFLGGGIGCGVRAWWYGWEGSVAGGGDLRDFGGWV